MRVGEPNDESREGLGAVGLRFLVHTEVVCGIVVGMGRSAEPVGRVVGVASPPSGLEDLFRREYENMYRLAVAMLGTDGDAEEVAQDAFVGVASRWDRLDNPGGYLRVSVVNGCRQKMRSRDSRRNAERAIRAERTAGPAGHREYLLDVLDRLTERQRVAVVLTYYSGLTSGEVSELMDCRPATVRSLVRHALKDLREVVER